MTFAQNTNVSGKVFDKNNIPIPDLLISVIPGNTVYKSDSSGKFAFYLEPGKYTIKFDHIKYKTFIYDVKIRPGVPERIAVKMLESDYTTEQIDVTDKFNDIIFMKTVDLDPEKLMEMPSMNSSASSILKTLGAATNNEFSSQYRVRGGNFDENLIYVNGIEVFRPMLVRAGKQEGLGFSNISLIRSISFSAGGFPAKYSDKLSSVLDIKYREPNKLSGTIELGVLTNNIHIEGSSKNKENPEDPGRFSFLIGARRFSTTYILKSLETTGDYRPNFLDFQSLLTFTPKMKPKVRTKINKETGEKEEIQVPENRLKFEWLTVLAQNKYSFEPEQINSNIGSFPTTLRLEAYFEGKELTNYNTAMSALSITHRPSYRLQMKYIISGFLDEESELFDVEGFYRICEVNPNFGDEDFNKCVFERGIGSYFRHARNYLNMSIFSAEQQGTWIPDKKYLHKIEWGIRGEYQKVSDQLSEWNGIDSAGYFLFDEVLKSEADFDLFRVKAYLQDNWRLDSLGTWRISYGIRFNYGTLNSELLLSPRVQFAFVPKKKLDNGKFENKDYQFRFAAGYYQQPPFYREMRDYSGNFNLNLKAQKSFHVIAGGDLLFKMWNRPFHLSSEAFYKKMWDVVPYDVENVRLRYYGQNSADAFAYGIDARVAGEFINGVESWFSIGLLNTKEDVDFDNQGYISRPSNQLLTIGMFFQDEMPFNPTFKMNLTLVYGSGMRFGPPRQIEYRNILTASPYFRADLGISKLLMVRIKEQRKKISVKSIWLALEVFNMFNAANTVSYNWIKDTYNVSFAFPNRLSGRMLNIRMITKF